MLKYNMKETEFQRLASAVLDALAELLEKADQNGELELEQQPGVLTVVLEGGKTLIVSQHAPSGQVWLSSPRSGGLHFSFEGGQWKLPDGRELSAVLRADIQALGGVAV